MTTTVSRDPILDIRKAVINGMCRIGMEPDKRLIDAVVDSLPDCFRQPLQAAEPTDEALKQRQRAEALLSACRAAFDSIMKHCAETGDVIWIDPPHQLGFVHESVCERLRNVIAQAEGLNVEQI
jgi:hypothetical protein